jgi:CrcB protein
MLNTLVAVFIGGGAGSLARWYVSMKMNGMSTVLPLGTLLVNLVGALIIGLVIAVFSRLPHLEPAWKLLLTTGFCGGLTTFSTFSLEVVYMLQEGRIAHALLNILLNLAGSLVMTLLAFFLVERFPYWQ